MGDVADEFGVEPLEVAWVESPQPPHLAATDVEDATRAVKLLGEEDREPAGLTGPGIGESGEHGGTGLGAPRQTTAVHAREPLPHLPASRGRFVQPEEFGLEAFPGELKLPRLGRGVSDVLEHGESALELDRIQLANRGHLLIFHPAADRPAGEHRPSHDDQAA